MEELSKLMFPDGRYKKIRKYVVDRAIINIAVMLWVGVSIVAVMMSHPHITSDLDYFSCQGPYDHKCENPFYQEPSWRNYEELPVGDYGNPGAERTIGLYALSTLGIFGVALSVNHRKHNRNEKNKSKVQNRKRKKRL